MTVLAVKNLTVRFGRPDHFVTAVDDLCFELRAGEIHAVVGESGSGKTVAMLSIGGLQPDGASVSGSILLDRQDAIAAGDPRNVRGTGIAYVFQDALSALNPVMTVGRQVDEALAVHTSLDAAGRRIRVIELFSLLGISAPAERYGMYPHQLSGGLRQRIMIAIALACNPRILIADEPTTALDVTVQAELLRTLKELKTNLGMSVIIITHDMGVVAEVADRVLVMYAGRRVELGEVERVLAAPAHGYTKALLSSVPQRGQRARDDVRLFGIPGSVPRIGKPPSLCTFADRCMFATEVCKRQIPETRLVGKGHLAACWHSDEVMQQRAQVYPSERGI